MTDDTPTQRLPEPMDAPAELAEERKKSKALLFTLVGVGAALLIAIVVLLLILFNGSRTAGPQPSPSESDTPTASPTPSESPTPTESATPTPTPTPTATADPPAPAPSAIVSYNVTDTDVDCDGVSSVPMTFNWNTTGQSVTFGVATDAADAEPYQTGLPAVGGITIDYQCGQPSDQQRYAIAVYHNGDVIARKTIIVKEH
jgi:cytoskeletal protein RodZ